MSDKPTTVEPIIVNRNNIDKQLAEMTFGKKSKNAGKVFFAPEISKDTLKTDLVWLGDDAVAAILSTAARRLFQSIYVNNVDEETGEFDREGFIEDARDLSVSAQTLSDIEEEMDELQTRQENIVNSADFGAVDNDGVMTPKALELMGQIKTIAAKLKPLRESKAEIEARYAVRAQKRKETKARKAAEAKAQAAAA